jgi:hypothetical protein
MRFSFHLTGLPTRPEGDVARLVPGALGSELDHPSDTAARRLPDHGRHDLAGGSLTQPAVTVASMTLRATVVAS